MENKKDIGHAVRSKLDGLQRQPAPAVWESIRADLDSQKKPRRFTLWLSAVTVIGVLAVFVTLGYVFGLILNQDYLPQVPVQNVENGNHGGDKSNDSATTTIVGSGDDKPKKTENTVSENENGGTNSSENETNGIVNPDETTAPNQKSINSANKHNGGNTLSGKDAAVTNSTSKDDATGNINSSGSGRILKANESGKIVNNTPAKAGRNNNSRTRNDRNIRGGSKQQNNSKRNNDSANLQQGAAVAYTKKNVRGGNTDKENATKASKSETSENATDRNIPKERLASNAGVNNEELTSEKDNTTATTSNEKIEPATIDSLAIANATDSLKKKDNNLADEKKKDDTTDDGYKQFYAYAYAAPTAFKYPSGKSLLDSKLNGNKASSKVTFNYGAFLGFKVTERFELRAGIAITRTEQETSGIVSDTTGNFAPSYAGIEYTNGVSNTTLSSRFNGQPFTIVQKTQFTEIPIEATYLLSGNRWGIKAIAGLSMVHIAKNEVIAQNNSTSLFMGSIKNTGIMSFNAGGGAGFFYQISPVIQLNAEPFIKYYVNTFTDAKPISFSLRIGLQYNFNLPKKKK